MLKSLSSLYSLEANTTFYLNHDSQKWLHFTDLPQGDNIAPYENFLIPSGNVKHCLSIILGYLRVFFQFLAIVSKTVWNICLQIFQWMFLFFLGNA